MASRQNSRVLASAVAIILMCHVPLVTVYVTFPFTWPGMPVESPSLSMSVKVMELLVTAATFQTRYDQLLVPLWRVFWPSFF